MAIGTGHGNRVIDGIGTVQLDIGRLFIRTEEVWRIVVGGADGGLADRAASRSLHFSVAVLGLLWRFQIAIIDDAEVEIEAGHFGLDACIGVVFDAGAIAEINVGQPNACIGLASGKV